MSPDSACSITPESLHPWLSSSAGVGYEVIIKNMIMKDLTLDRSRLQLVADVFVDVTEVALGVQSRAVLIQPANFIDLDLGKINWGCHGFLLLNYLTATESTKWFAVE
jgi:hypothetical protein